MPHISDARSSKAPFELAKILSLVQQAASATVGKSKPSSLAAWEAVGNYVAHVIQEINALLPLAMEPENITKSKWSHVFPGLPRSLMTSSIVTGKAPWVVRIDEIKANTTVNLEAERKAAQLNDELQSLVRTLKAKDQHIQEVGVKIALMERRMEGAKRQADAIAELEAELAKAQKQERAYEEAMEQLQNDLDNLEKDNARLKAAASQNEKQASEAARPEAETVAVESNFETSYLLEQVSFLVAVFMTFYSYKCHSLKRYAAPYVS
jgi:dynactin 1